MSKELEDRGIDYDLEACLRFNPQDNFNIDDIHVVIAVWEGQNDVDSWRWILRLNTGKYAFLVGWCDYTGWDCRSGADSLLADSPSVALEQSQSISDDYLLADNNDEVLNSLTKQIEEGKNKTWREETGPTMRDVPTIDIKDVMDKK